MSDDESASKYSPQDILYDIKKTIAESNNFEIEKINMSDKLVDDLQLDSLDLITLVVDLESEYKVRINERVLDGIETVKDCFNVILDYFRAEGIVED